MKDAVVNILFMVVVRISRHLPQDLTWQAVLVQHPNSDAVRMDR